MKQFITFNIFLILILLHTLFSFVSAQGIKNYFSRGDAFPTGGSLLISDSLALVNLPVLSPAGEQLKSTLPAVHDNAGEPYFMPLFEQVSNECGQYAAISFTFCYEVNRARGTQASSPANQFPTHYTYNFMNGGYGWYGVSYFHSLEVARVNGHPSVADFGTMNSCGPSHWMSGYDSYRSGMSNKIDQIFQIPAGTPDGLLVLKNWLHNHLAGDETGSIACFYSSTPWNLSLLPAGTPEGGKHVITNWSSPAGHANTICGYNDSIRYDYNQDGQYTNHIDINGDGKVDMRDWELGGLRFTDSYIDGANWADSGFAYMMYKTLADSYGEGGIWNNAVHVVTVKDDYEPMLSMKVTLEHDCRDRIRILAGASELATGAVDHTMGFPIFNYQGGCQHMQGGFEPEARTLELGLDITPLLGHLRSGQEGAIYLLVQEDDFYNQGTGKILELSVIDHMHNDQEWTFGGGVVPLHENGMTIIGIPLTLEFDELQVTTQNLPVAYTGEEYGYQLHASGGTAPYSWKLVRHFTEDIYTEEAPAAAGEVLQMSDTVHGHALQLLDFEFPFYNSTYDSVWVHTDGFLMFDGQTYPWPYLYDEELMIRKTRIVAPCLNNRLYIASSGDNGIWYEGNGNRASFRWKVTSGQPAGKEFDFTVELYQTGEIRFYIDAEEFTPDHTWAAGLSDGDGSSYQSASYSSINPGPGDYVTIFTPEPFPDGISFSESGLLQGVPEKNHTGLQLLFEVTDASVVSRRKALLFHSYYAGTEEEPRTDIAPIRIWPVPASRALHLEVDLPGPARLTMELCDLQGETQLEIHTGNYPAGTVRHTMDLGSAGLASGVYLMKVSTEDRLIGVQKVITIP